MAELTWALQRKHLTRPRTEGYVALTERNSGHRLAGCTFERFAVSHQTSVISHQPSVIHVSTRRPRGEPMRAVDIIRKKRDGGELSGGEIAWMVAGIASGEVADYQWSALLM